MKGKILHPVSTAALMLGLVCLFFSGCSSSRLTNVWRDPAYKLGPMKSMLIISISKDPTRRRIWEDGFVSEFAKYGIAATPSYSLFPKELPDTNSIADAIEKNGYDGMLTISRLHSQTRLNIVDPYVSETPVAVYNPWRKRYRTRVEEVYHPGYVDSMKIVRHEVDIWAAKETSHMVWSGICETTDPPSSEQLHDETLSLIAPLLSKSGILPPKN